VLVRIAASGDSVLDTKIRAGKAAHARQLLPAVLGLEMAGTMVEAGDAVTAFREGDEVYGMVGGVGGLQGTLAQFILADAALLAHKPRSLTMRAAAALPLNCLTAWEGLVDQANVQAGQKVLVHGGAGGVGHLAVQIAVAFGAEVFATVSPGKAGIVESFGAVPLDYTHESVEAYVLAHTAGAGFDIVYDTVGGNTIDASFRAVRTSSGRVVSCLGWSTHSLAPLSFRAATYSGVFTLRPLLTGNGRAHHGEILRLAAELVDSRRLNPLLNERRFLPADLDDAYVSAAAGGLGKTVLDIPG
jgi:NADPH:quinone reductase-like Zn-dependent oxidoreductase